MKSSLRMDIFGSVLSGDKSGSEGLPALKRTGRKASVLMAMHRWGTFTERFWQLFGRRVTAWRFGGLRCCPHRLALSATDRGEGPWDGGPPLLGARHIHRGDERWQPGTNRISTPSLSATLRSVFVWLTEWLGSAWVGWGWGELPWQW